MKGKSRMKNWELALCLLLGCGTALGIKYIYGNAGSDGLLWILAPTAWWTRILGGIAFTYEPGVGYVNHAFQFIIAPSCAGVRFFIISFLMLTVSFVSRRKNLGQGMLWIARSMGIAWLYTCLVNGVRMVLSIRVPPVLEGAGIGGNWLTWERLHTIIGTAVYFTALLLLYRLGEWLSERIGQIKPALQTRQGMEAGQIALFLREIWKPILWYILPVLVIPLLNRILRQNYKGLAEYIRLVGGVCLILSFILYLVRLYCFRRSR